MSTNLLVPNRTRETSVAHCARGSTRIACGTLNTTTRVASLGTRGFYAIRKPQIARPIVNFESLTSLTPSRRPRSPVHKSACNIMRCPVCGSECARACGPPCAPAYVSHVYALLRAQDQGCTWCKVYFRRGPVQHTVVSGGARLFSFLLFLFLPPCPFSGSLSLPLSLRAVLRATSGDIYNGSPVFPPCRTVNASPRGSSRRRAIRF